MIISLSFLCFNLAANILSSLNRQRRNSRYQDSSATLCLPTKNHPVWAKPRLASAKPVLGRSPPLQLERRKPFTLKSSLLPEHPSKLAPGVSSNLSRTTNTQVVRCAYASPLSRETLPKLARRPSLPPLTKRLPQC